MTRNPHTLWVALQLRETWEYGEQPQRFLLFDRDAKFSAEVLATVKDTEIVPIRTAFRSPWRTEWPSAGWAACGETCSIM